MKSENTSKHIYRPPQCQFNKENTIKLEIERLLQMLLITCLHVNDASVFEHHLCTSSIKDAIQTLHKHMVKKNLMLYMRLFQIMKKKCCTMLRLGELNKSTQVDGVFRISRKEILQWKTFLFYRLEKTRLDLINDSAQSL